MTGSTLRPTPGQVADALLVAEAGPAGRPAADIDGNTRAALLRRGWIVALHDGAPVGWREWAAMLWITPAGQHAATAEANRPVALGNVDAYPLAEIEAAGAAGHDGWWPGRKQALRVARCWRLIAFTPRSPHTGPELGLYRLTAAGTAALIRWRAQLVTPGRASPAQGKVLLCVDRLGIAPLNAGDATYLCVEYGWISRTANPGRPFTLTPAGRQVMVQHLLASPVDALPAPQVRRALARDLKPGDLCRLAHRRGWRNLGPDWVTVRRTVRVPHPGGWQVWVDDGAGGERPYVDGLLGYQARFEVRAGRRA